MDQRLVPSRGGSRPVDRARLSHNGVRGKRAMEAAAEPRRVRARRRGLRWRWAYPGAGQNMTLTALPQYSRL
jgi:hypothetical protein